MFYIGGFAPQVSKFQQVIDGDGLDLISFDSLQLLLIQYENQLELANNHNLKIQNTGELDAFWNRHLVVRIMLRLADHDCQDLFKNDSSSSFTIDVAAVLSNPEFENIIVNRLMLLHSARQRLIHVQDYAESIKSFVEQHYQL